MTTHPVSDAQASQPNNLVDRVSEILAQHGHPRPTAWQTGLHPDALMAGQSEALQRFFINRYWRLQLGKVDDSTANERYCLGDIGDVAGWLSTFDSLVAKCIVKHNLPPIVH